MRAFALGLILSVAAAPCLAQTVLKSEPLILAPYEIAFVQDVSCPPGKVLKVTGAIRGLHRRKACVTLASHWQPRRPERVNRWTVIRCPCAAGHPAGMTACAGTDGRHEPNTGSACASRSASALFRAGSSCGSGWQGLIS